ncbi:MAG: hypothetical protein M3R25_05485, partial [Bacteroidota bacterium]|nr:hypothetical protein [Bacteroidota bacterium]
AVESNTIVQENLGYLGLGEYVDSETVKFSNSAQVIAPLVETIQQWQCALGMKYDVSRTFFVEGGAMFGFATTAQSRYPIVSYDPINIPPTGDAFSVENSFDNYDVIRSATTSLFGGLGIRPARRIEIYLQYQHALDAYLNADEDIYSVDTKRTDYIRGINLGFRYHL